MKRVTVLIIAVLMAMSSTVYAGSSDKELANQWKAKHCPKAHVEKVVTVSQGGYKGKVKGKRYTVKYPRKVAKGKTVNVYMVVKGGDVKAMVCLGKVK